MTRTASLLGALLLAACTTQTVEVSRNQALPSTDRFQSLLNKERTRRGLTPLVPSPRLAAAARAHAADMSAGKYFSHHSRDGRELADRVRQQGYDFCLVAENITWGRETAADVIAGWMRSPGHRKNILLGKAREYGMGYADDNYWVLVVGKPGC